MVCVHRGAGQRPGHSRLRQANAPVSTGKPTRCCLCLRLCSALLSLPTGLLICSLFSLARRHLSSAEGAFSVVLWLLDHGADVNSIDRFKRTPLEVRAQLDSLTGGHPGTTVACMHTASRWDSSRKAWTSCGALPNGPSAVWPTTPRPRRELAPPATP